MMIDKNKITMEEALSRLEQIVKILEKKELALPELMERYEEGMDLLNYCRLELNKAEEKVKIIKLKENKLLFEEFE